MSRLSGRGRNREGIWREGGGTGGRREGDVSDGGEREGDGGGGAFLLLDVSEHHGVLQGVGHSPIAGEVWLIGGGGGGKGVHHWLLLVMALA